MNQSLGQHFLAALDGPEITPEVEVLITRENVLGFTLFRRNITDVDQLAELNHDLQHLAHRAGYELILAVDQEGGRVFRLPEPFSQIPPMRLWGELFARTADATFLRDLGMILGREIQAVGFNLDFAPVVDVDSNPLNPIIGDRSFANNGADVAKAAEHVILGLLESGVIPCLKHFPGHGDTATDSHLELPKDERSKGQLDGCDLIPYQKLIRANLAPTIMTAHVLYPQLDAENPATLSSKILTGILRDELKYEGVVFSDDLFMKAIADRFDLADAAQKFFIAGGDVALVCKDPKLCLDIIHRTRLHLSKSNPETHILAENLKKSRTRIDELKARYLKPCAPQPIAELTANHREYLSKIFNAQRQKTS